MIASVISGAAVSLSRGRAMGECGRAGRLRMKAVMGVTVAEDMLTDPELLRSTPITKT